MAADIEVKKIAEDLHVSFNTRLAQDHEVVKAVVGALMQLKEDREQRREEKKRSENTGTR